MDNLNYGVIGNCKSSALISEKGSIDWCCLPDFNSSSIFAKILDEKAGGSFEIIVDKTYSVSQSYIKNTNLLRTTFANENSSFQVIDFMPRYQREDGKYFCPPDIIRYFKLINGTPEFRIKFNPKLEYAKKQTKSKILNEYIKSITVEGDYDSLYLYTDINKSDVLEGKKIRIAKDCFFMISYNQKLVSPSISRCKLLYHRTLVYWLNWSEKTKKFSQYSDEINRSALTLKLLTYEKSGAILAAMTTSLPETIREERNWDYRFCWIRDSSMTIKVLNDLCHNGDAKRFLNFILNLINDKDEKLQIMYGINGERKLTEYELSHLRGYKNSTPVRIGNAAYKQKQNDIYGVLVDVIYQQFSFFDIEQEARENLWTLTRSIVRIVKKNWMKPDMGIWELRTSKKHFTFSKVLCWVAIDRAIKISKIIGKNDYADEWIPLANKIKNEIFKKAWNEEVNSFTQSYGSTDLDASTLLMEQFGFIDAKDEKFVATVLATKKHLSQNGLMYRYKNEDDFGRPSSSFTICTFWLINSLIKIGRVSEARKMFEKLLTYSNHVGLFSEDIDFKTKRLLGNFPQAYSHLALIETAISLAEKTAEK